MSTEINIFISYGRADARDLAIRLRDDLQAAGYQVWLDLSEIPGGASWSVNIEEAIEHCHVALALMSKSSHESPWCRAEQLRAMRKGKQVIPLLVQTDAEPPLILEHLNYLDFSEARRYDEMLRDLLTDITAGQAFRVPQTEIEVADATPPKARSPFKAKRRSSSRRTATRYKNEKRNAAAFRRYINELRREDWLGARYWWPYFLFYFTDIQQVVEILKSEEMLSAFELGGQLDTRWDKFVRLDFRPRTPSLFRNEGLRPISQSPGNDYCALPVYLLFDLEATICHPEARFSDGDPVKIKKTYKTPSRFNELPFEQIYHDSWFMPDERDEIMRCREAQVVLPDRLGLEGLQIIWMRSPAEYETLRNLLPPKLWDKWRDKVTARTDYHLFNRKWVYVEDVTMTGTQIQFRFNPCERKKDCGPFYINVTVTYEDGNLMEWEQEVFEVTGDLTVNIPSGENGYSVRMTLDGDLSYLGKYHPEEAIL